MRTTPFQPGTSSVAAALLLTTLLAAFAPNTAYGQTTAFEVTRTSDGASLLKILDNGNVGIGTTSPAFMLDVNGNLDLSNGGFRFVNSASANFILEPGQGILSGNAKVWTFGNWNLRDTEENTILNANTHGLLFRYTANQTTNPGFFIHKTNAKASINTVHPQSTFDVFGNMSVGAYAGVNGSPAPSNGLIVSGNVGIGTTSPAEKLDVAGTARMTGFKMPTGATNGYVLTSDASGVGTWQAASGGGVGGSGTTNFVSKFTASTTLGNSGIFEDGSGNVGVGTTSPLSKLDVRGVLLGQTDGANVISVSSLNKAAILGASGGLAVSGAHGRGAVTGITRSTNASEAALFAEVFSPGGATGLIVQQDGTGDIVQFVDLNTTVFVVKDGGNVGIGTTGPGHPLEMGSGAHVTSGGVWTNASSRAYKENISPLPLESALETLAALRPVAYNYKVDKDERYVGFIAEDVPDLVATKDRKSLASMDIVAVLTKVVQDQQRAIAQQQAELATLRASVARLEATLRPEHQGDTCSRLATRLRNSR